MHRFRLSILLLAILAAACGTDQQETVDDVPAVAPRTDANVEIDSQPLPPLAGPLPERPPLRVDTLMVEGMAEVIELRLVLAPASFPVRYSTYLPEAMEVEFNSASSEYTAIFSRDVGGNAAGAIMNVTMYPAGTTRLLVEDAVRELILSRGPGTDVSEAMDPPAWGEWAVRLSYPRSRDQWFAGSAVIGQYGPRYFSVVQLYPAEYGDGIIPRFEAILDHWRWEDTGLMLKSPGRSTR